MSPVLEKWQTNHQAPNAWPWEPSCPFPPLHTFFPSYGQRRPSQHPPSLGHPSDPAWYHTFPCLSTHGAESLCPISLCLFPSSISRDASSNAALEQQGWSGGAQLSREALVGFHGERVLQRPWTHIPLPLPGHCTGKQRCCWDGRSAGRTASSQRQTCGALWTVHSAPSGCTWEGQSDA